MVFSANRLQILDRLIVGCVNEDHHPPGIDRGPESKVGLVTSEIARPAPIDGPHQISANSMPFSGAASAAVPSSALAQKDVLRDVTRDDHSQKIPTGHGSVHSPSPMHPSADRQGSSSRAPERRSRTSQAENTASVNLVNACVPFPSDSPTYCQLVDISFHVYIFHSAHSPAFRSRLRTLLRRAFL
jgi:hypothetical protein